MPKVSVIIPVYKVEQYLHACLNSMEAQTYQDFELILVDDGTPDSCGEICDNYAETHPNTKVLHQENAGLSEARNQGVKIASGEYVTFIDSDDYVAEDYLEYLMMLIEKYQVDISIACNVKFLDANKPSFNNDKLYDCSVTASEALEKICYNEYSICAWGKMYKREIVEKYPYPKGQLYEDTATTYKIVGSSKKVAYGNKVIYFWRQREGSITHSKINERHFYGIYAAKEQLKYMEKNYPGVVPAAQVRCAMRIMDIAYRIVMGGNDKCLFYQVKLEMDPLVKDVLMNRNCGLSLKVRTLALWMGYIPFWVVSTIYSKLKWL